MIELGVPFSDPLADGPVIQRASERAVARGVRLRDVLALAKELRAARPACGLVLFSYLNPVVRMGMKAFCSGVQEAGADGVLLTDMIVEEAGEYLVAMAVERAGADLSGGADEPGCAAAGHLRCQQGFVYAISRVGITGTQEKVASDAPELVARLRQFTELPIAVGFGISNAAHVRAVGEFADAAIIGSALVALIERSAPADAARAVGEFVSGLRAGPVAAEL